MNKWIPVSERLPEDRREVLVTAYWHETYQVMMASYFGNGLWWCVPFNNCGKHMQRLKPKAWMPLPDPYKEKQILGHCKECKYFEYDSLAKVDGIPLIVAHEICKRWGDGCKTKEDGYCFLFEPRTEGEEI